MTDIVEVPAAPVVPPFPALGSPNFNQEAYDNGSAMPGVTQRVHEIAQATHANAVIAQAAATSATGIDTAARESELAAAGSASAAALSKSAAADSAGAAESSRVAASKLHLGDKAAPPTKDNQGGALRLGTTYYNTVSGAQFVYGLTGWELGISAVAGVSSINGLTGDVILPMTAGVTLDGDTTIYVTQSKAYTITNYNVFSDYVVQASAGSVSIAGSAISYAAPAAAQEAVLTVTMDGEAVPFSLQILPAGIQQPTNTGPAAGAVNVGASPALTSSAFAAVGLTDTHAASRWRVYQGAALLHDSGWVGALTAYSVPAGIVVVSQAYSWTVEHRGTALGDSAPSVATAFATAPSFGGSVGTAGAQGFGVGEYSGALPAGFSALAGTSDKASENYGNYQYSDGSIMVFVPKFYYRIGSASSPRYGVYGANAIDIASIAAYADETAANAAGYALHRAFKDGGAIKSGFFVDKYLASKTGTTSCKSIANADPISLTTSAGYNPSSGMTGCTGILADAVVLARSRGAGVFNVASIFMYDALAKLALAHGQAATGAVNCAWYDAAGTTNFPKGCNNGALADTNDATVTYAVSTTSPKPKTRATANFAKTTHNGQECGVADVNGPMYQAMLGLTMAGTSATDTAANGAGNSYALKTSVALASLTGGFGGATDAWGSAANLATNYDLINGFLPWAATTGWDYFGNGAGQVFSGATSGTDYLRSCCGIAALTGMSAAGTSQFGNDGNYRSGPANLFPVASGSWGGAGGAGVFCRVWGNSRSADNHVIGFRACAFGN